MPTSILVAYATERGSTREVAERVASILDREGFDVETLPAADVQDVSRYDGVVLGSGLYMGRAHRDARRLLARHRRELQDLPFAVFAMGPDKLAPAEVAGSRKQLDRALARVPELQPFAIAIFGGVVDPSTFRFPLNRLPASDARDWDAIETWGTALAREFAVRGAEVVAS